MGAATIRRACPRFQLRASEPASGRGQYPHPADQHISTGRSNASLICGVSIAYPIPQKSQALRLAAGTRAFSLYLLSRVLKQPRQKNPSSAAPNHRKAASPQQLWRCRYCRSPLGQIGNQLLRRVPHSPPEPHLNPAIQKKAHIGGGISGGNLLLRLEPAQI